MKSFDEVTKALSICGRHPDCEGCPYENVSYPTEIGNTCKDIMHYDALYYMKGYERISAKLEKIALGNITETLEKLDNPALSWSELQQMEGKPVWVDHKYYNKWLIVYEVYENTIVLDGNGFYTQYFSDDNDKEVRWQAYRKERG